MLCVTSTVDDVASEGLKGNLPARPISSYLTIVFELVLDRPEK